MRRDELGRYDPLYLLVVVILVLIALRLVGLI